MLIFKNIKLFSELVKLILKKLFKFNNNIITLEHQLYQFITFKILNTKLLKETDYFYIKIVY